MPVANKYIHARNSNLRLARFRTFIDNQLGSTSVVFGFMLPVLVGSMGLAAEVSYWELHHRAMQNAADAGAIAAATNGTSSYATEAQAVAGQCGFQNGSGNVSVAASNPASASGCAANCYTVTISDKVPLFLSSVVGYKGNTSVGGKGMTLINATSVATSATAYPYCILALAGSGKPGITSNGAPRANLSATYNAHNLGASIGDAVDTNSGCGIIPNSNVRAISDPYAGLASQIPSDTCGGSYPQEPAKKNDPALPSANQWNGTYSVTGYKILCGDQQLTGNTTISAANGAVFVIENGQLDTNGYTFGTGRGVLVGRAVTP
jgi:Flp pilus assembly protein TadG